MLRMEKAHADQMVAHSLEEDPNECCGILTGTDDVVSKVHRITNTARSPFRYLMDPQEQLNVMLESERSGHDILAFYHSHTHSPAYPSPTDVRVIEGEYVVAGAFGLQPMVRCKMAVSTRHSPPPFHSFTCFHRGRSNRSHQPPPGSANRLEDPHVAATSLTFELISAAGNRAFDLQRSGPLHKAANAAAQVV